MQFLVDENLGKRFSNLLKRTEYVFVGDAMRGATNGKVLAKAERVRKL